VAEWFYLPEMKTSSQSNTNRRLFISMLQMPTPNFGDSRNNISRHAQTFGMGMPQSIKTDTHTLFLKNLKQPMKRTAYPMFI